MQVLLLAWSGFQTCTWPIWTSNLPPVQDHPNFRPQHTSHSGTKSKSNHFHWLTSAKLCKNLGCPKLTSELLGCSEETSNSRTPSMLLTTFLPSAVISNLHAWATSPYYSVSNSKLPFALSLYIWREWSTWLRATISPLILTWTGAPREFAIGICQFGLSKVCALMPLWFARASRFQTLRKPSENPAAKRGGSFC